MVSDDKDNPQNTGESLEDKVDTIETPEPGITEELAEVGNHLKEQLEQHTEIGKKITLLDRLKGAYEHCKQGFVNVKEFYQGNEGKNKEIAHTLGAFVLGGFLTPSFLSEYYGGISAALIYAGSKTDKGKEFYQSNKRTINTILWGFIGAKSAALLVGNSLSDLIFGGYTFSEIAGATIGAIGYRGVSQHTVKGFYERNPTLCESTGVLTTGAAVGLLLPLFSSGVGALLGIGGYGAFKTYKHFNKKRIQKLEERNTQALEKSDTDYHPGV